MQHQLIKNCCMDTSSITDGKCCELLHATLKEITKYRNDNNAIKHLHLRHLFCGLAKFCVTGEWDKVERTRKEDTQWRLKQKSQLS